MCKGWRWNGGGGKTERERERERSKRERESVGLLFPSFFYEDSLSYLKPPLPPPPSPLQVAADQLKREMKAGNVFGGFREGAINFPPTYRWMRDKMEFSNKRNQVRVCLV